MPRQRFPPASAAGAVLFLAFALAAVAGRGCHRRPLDLRSFLRSWDATFRRFGGFPRQCGRRAQISLSAALTVLDGGQVHRSAVREDDAARWSNSHLRVHSHLDADQRSASRSLRRATRLARFAGVAACGSSKESALASNAANTQFCVGRSAPRRSVVFSSSASSIRAERLEDEAEFALVLGNASAGSFRYWQGG